MMSVKKRSTLHAWLDEKRNSGEQFNFWQQLEDYCRKDVVVLARCSMKFRDLMIKEADCDPFESSTIAGVCMKIFKQNFLTESWMIRLAPGEDWVEATKQKKQFYFTDDNGDNVTVEEDGVEEAQFVSSPIAHVPSEGYIATDTHSKVSIEWLEYEGHKLRQTGKRPADWIIQHALNDREKKCIPYCPHS